MAHFQDAYDFWVQGRLTQEEAAALLGVSDCTFRRWVERHDGGGVDALVDRCLGRGAHNEASVNEVRHLPGAARRLERSALLRPLPRRRRSPLLQLGEEPAAGGGRSRQAHPMQFKQAMDRLGIDSEPAYSPEVRGCLERMFGDASGVPASPLLPTGNGGWYRLARRECRLVSLGMDIFRLMCCNASRVGLWDFHHGGVCARRRPFGFVRSGTPWSVRVGVGRLRCAATWALVVPLGVAKACGSAVGRQAVGVAGLVAGEFRGGARNPWRG